MNPLAAAVEQGCTKIDDIEDDKPNEQEGDMIECWVAGPGPASSALLGNGDDVEVGRSVVDCRHTWARIDTLKSGVLATNWD